MSRIREKASTAVWFLQRPTFWPHALELTIRQFVSEPNDIGRQEEVRSWARALNVPWTEALSRLNLITEATAPPQLPTEILQEGEARARQAKVIMGGPGHVELLYAAVLLTGAHRIVETGVAYGWSTLAILAALKAKQRGLLVSVDMPYPKMNNESFVGIVVPDDFKEAWHLIREPDRYGLDKAIQCHNGEIDLAHYDSDKSYRGRMYAYPKIWDALRMGGVFISDDIQDNFAFRDFCESGRIKFQVIPYGEKFVGIARKG